MTTSVGAINNFQYIPGVYSDFDDIGMDFSTYPMFGAGGSIFGGDMMMPMTPGFGGYNSSSYFDYMKDCQKFYNDYNIRQQKLQRNADLKINASLEALKGAAVLLKDKVVNNEQDQIPLAFEKYLTAVRAAYGKGTESEIKARALTLYAQMNGGKTLYQDLRDYSHGSFTQGAIQSLTMSTYNRRSAEDNISEISGSPVGTSEKTNHNLGRLFGATTAGLGTFGIVKGLSKGAEAAGVASKFGTKAAAIAGLVVGSVSAILSFVTGKATT